MTLNRHPKISRSDIVIDLPPRIGSSLRHKDDVLMPVEYPDGKEANAKCGPKNHDMYLNGTFQDGLANSLWVVDIFYTRTYILLNFIHRLRVYKISCGYRTLEHEMMAVS